MLRRADSAASISSSVGSDKSYVSGDDAGPGVDDFAPATLTVEPSLRPPPSDGPDRGGGTGSGTAGGALSGGALGIYQGNWGGRRAVAEHSE